MKQPWAYKVMTFKPGFFGLKSVELETELNKLGLLGWELVSTVSIGMAVTCFFKKQG